MRNATFRRGAWTITTRGDRAPNPNRNVNHGSNTLIGGISGALSLAGGRGCYHGVRCDACVLYPCAKNPPADLNYCLMNPNRFTPALRAR